jgi:macrolide-specific efflux system membrane fusion protein
MKLTPGMPVYFTTLGSQDRRWQGDVRQILPSPETINDVILYNVLVDVSNEDRQLMTGMTTQLFFQLAIAGDMPMIPLSALGRRLPEEDTAEGEAYEVMVAASGGKPQPRTVIVHLQDRSNAAIASGLDAGEYVLAADAAAGTSFERRLPPGMRGL